MSNAGSQPPPEIPGYEIVRPLGQGGFATVYEARQLSVDRLVALKVVAVTGLAPVVERRFRDEVRTIGSLSWHPNVVALHDGGISPAGLPFLAMELVTGGSWDQRIADEGPCSPETAIEVGIQVANALAAAHDAGIVHRDVKPDNVLVGRLGEALLADFGVATVTDGSMALSGSFVGTLAYAAPELLQGSAADARSDVYAVGMTLHTLLAGDAAFGAAKDESPAAVIYRVLQEDKPRLPPGVPGALADAVDHATARDPADRPATAAALATELRVVGDALAAPTTPRPPPPPALDPPGTATIAYREGGPTPPPLASRPLRDTPRPGPPPRPPSDPPSSPGDDAGGDAPLRRMPPPARGIPGQRGEAAAAAARAEREARARRLASRPSPPDTASPPPASTATTPPDGRLHGPPPGLPTDRFGPQPGRPEPVPVPPVPGPVPVPGGIQPEGDRAADKPRPWATTAAPGVWPATIRALISTVCCTPIGVAFAVQAHRRLLTSGGRLRGRGSKGRWVVAFAYVWTILGLVAFLVVPVVTFTSSRDLTGRYAGTWEGGADDDPALRITLTLEPQQLGLDLGGTLATTGTRGCLSGIDGADFDGDEVEFALDGACDDDTPAPAALRLTLGADDETIVLSGDLDATLRRTG